MPQPALDWDLHTGNTLITEQLDYNREEESNMAATMVPQLNLEQHHSYDAVLSAVLSGSGQTFFLSGAGGTGKTFVYRTLCHTLRGMGRIVICVASSGIAALLLPGGCTSHSMLKIPIEGPVVLTQVVTQPWTLSKRVCALTPQFVWFTCRLGDSHNPPQLVWMM